MQPFLAAPRDTGLTAQQVTDLVQCDNLQVGAGLELLDHLDAFIADISGSLIPSGAEVQWAADQRLPLSGALSVSTELQWGWQRVKPYLTLTDLTTGDTARFNLGVYLMSTAATPAGESLPTWQVDLFDKLAAVDVPIGATYHVASTDLVLTKVAALLAAAGETRVRLSSTQSAATFPTDKVWAIDDANTYLSVANEMLALVGYEALWSDWDGWVTSAELVASATRSPEWTYDADDQDTTIVGQDRKSITDFWSVPNVWIFVVDNPGLLLQPIEGNGIYTVTNQSDGPTSIDARRRTIRTVVPLDAVNQAALVAQGDKLVEQQKRVTAELEITSGPNPLHAHLDVVTVVDSALGIDGKFLSSTWTLPLDGGDMTHRFKEV